ncbi:MAG TPA: hypothetical protein VFV92_07890, partial [Candidatus Bathyarchaeia archaeon]|nr:hypothetical protein [Candidatus Bathyarchaeia archaeon]
MSRLKQPEEMPPVKTKVLYRYRKQDGAVGEISVKIWRCNYRLTTRTKCPTKIEGPNVGPVQFSAN